MTVAAAPDSNLLELLACPNCYADLAADRDNLRCTGCPSLYPVTDGIPILMPDTVDVAHLREEESLALMMRTKGASPRMEFNRRLWALSKREFWSVVRNTVPQTGKRFLYVGCGYDTSFREFEGSGHVFVNFDLIFGMLRTLRTDFGAKSCVNGDVHRLPFRRGAFDYVATIDLLHHESEQLPEILTALSGLLKPNGVLFIEDVNATGLFQLPKSMLPKPIYRALRSAYHEARGSIHRPADYEVPTNVWRVKSILRSLGFKSVRAHPHEAYPEVGSRAYGIYRALGRAEFVLRYFNYHYMVSAVKAA